MRMLWVFILFCFESSAFLFRAVTAMTVGRRKHVPRFLGETLSHVCEQLGGAFLKCGQILSTRVDLLHPDIVSSLVHLRDNVRPLQFNDLQSLLVPLTAAPGYNSLLEIDSLPLASATMAQVHVGTYPSTGQRVAIKIRRPGIDRVLLADIYYIQFFANFIARLPYFHRFPISEATNELCMALRNQVDFKAEAKMLERFRRLFSDNPDIKVPKVDLGRCNNDIIVMEFLEGYRPFQDFRERPDLAKSAVQIGLRALYKMIFNAGLIHCDLHASNILCNEKGMVALLDFGFVSEITPKDRRNFAKFFLSIIFRDGKTAARIIKETALRVSGELDMFSLEQDMQSLIDKNAGRKAADFKVSCLVFELFQIQGRHGIYGSPSFTLPILSLLTYEGLIKDLYPEIDFQQEAIPFVMSALHYDSAVQILE